MLTLTSTMRILFVALTIQLWHSNEGKLKTYPACTKANNGTEDLYMRDMMRELKRSITYQIQTSNLECGKGNHSHSVLSQVKFMLLAEIETKMSAQEENMSASIHARFQEMKAVQQQLTKENQKLNNANQDLKVEIEKLNNKLESFTYKMEQLEKNIGTTPSPSITKVAFTAVLTKTLSLGQIQIIEYDKVITNVGNAYDPRHGHFTAPTKAVYLMACTVMNKSGGDVFVEMVKNGTPVGSLYGDSSDYNMGTQVSIVLLEKGDMVWVRHGQGAGSQTLHSAEYNTFSGTILFQM